MKVTDHPAFKRLCLQLSLEVMSPKGTTFSDVMTFIDEIKKAGDLEGKQEVKNALITWNSLGEDARSLLEVLRKL
jgi:hypothetical protein